MKLSEEGQIPSSMKYGIWEFIAAYCIHKVLALEPSEMLLLLSLLLLYSNLAGGLHLLAIGDSFDRIFGHEWCSVKSHSLHGKNVLNFNETKAIVWGSPDLGIKDHQTPMYCADPMSSDSYAQIMICGSSATGPYYHYNEHRYETKYRIEIGLRDYFDSFKRLPDRIIFCTIQWDAAYQTYMRAREWSGEVDQLVTTFERNVLARISEIKTILNAEVSRRKAIGDNTLDSYKPEIALRTTTWRNTRGILTSKYNDATRRLAAANQLSLYDLDYDVWSTVDYHRTNENCANFGLFRDDVGHPISLYSYFSVEKMMSKAYSPFMSTSGRNESLSIPVLSSLPSSDTQTYRLMRAACTDAALNRIPAPITDINRIQEVLPIPGCGPLYFSRVLDGQRVKWFIGELSEQYHKTETTAAGSSGNSGGNSALAKQQYESRMKVDLEHMLVSSTETRLVTPDILDSIPTKGVMPLLFNYTQVKAFTVESEDDSTIVEYYIVFTNRAIFRLPSAAVLALYQVPPEYVLDRVDRSWLDILCYESPQVFHDHALYRFSDEKFIYTTINLTRHVVSEEAMNSKGFTPERIILMDRDRMEKLVTPIPLGEPLV